MAAKKFLVTIERIRKETYQMVLEKEHLMSALDEARLISKERTRTSGDGSVYSVAKIESVKGE